MRYVIYQLFFVWKAFVLASANKSAHTKAHAGLQKSTDAVVFAIATLKLTLRPAWIAEVNNDAATVRNNVTSRTSHVGIEILPSCQSENMNDHDKNTGRAKRFVRSSYFHHSESWAPHCDNHWRLCILFEAETIPLRPIRTNIIQTVDVWLGKGHIWLW